MTTEALVAQAIAALKKEDFVSAREFITKYARAHPLELQHYLIQGLAEMALADWNAALATFDLATGQFPREAQLWFNLGVTQENLGEIKNAVIAYEQSLELKPDQAEACGNLSNLYCRQARFVEAEKFARRALGLGAPKAQALNSLGLALNRQNKFAEARTTFEEALRLEPNDAFVLSNLANLAVDQLDFERSWPYFAKARTASDDDPLIRHQEGMARLLAGDYEKGWPLCEARLEKPGALRVQPPCPRWQGQPLKGKKLMLVAEQGFGDAIQFCRYGSLLKDAELIWVVPKSLQRVLSRNVSGRVLSEKETLPEVDYYLPILSLPLAFGLLKPEEAPTAPYLNTDIAPSLPDKGKGTKIGLVWTGSPTHERDFERSIPLKTFAPLFKNSRMQLYASFTDTGLEQIGDAPITRLDHLIKDFADTAGLLKQLDCLITVDTAAAHLAGALGVKTYLLLPYCPDWRWGTKGETTTWYPNLTLIRQTKPGDWQNVLMRLLEQLRLPA
jgi:Flp pilus assembly protein TadD